VTTTTWLIVIGVVLVVLYVWSVFHWPRKRCRKCYPAAGRDFGPLPGSWTFRRCRRCNGRGWHVRRMRRILGGPLDDGAGVYQGP
jgi:hypothetical protein